MKKITLLSGLLFLAACSSEPGDLREWMDQTQAEAKKNVHVSKVPSVDVNTTYQAPVQPKLNDFDAKRLVLSRQGANAPDMNRPKEILEGFSLENLKYVGSLQQGKQASAFIEADGHVYTVNVGNYLGQNYGRITQILPGKIILTETVEDMYGEWTPREAEVVLSVNAGNSK